MQGFCLEHLHFCQNFMKRTSLQILAFASLLALSACSKEKADASASDKGTEAAAKPATPAKTKAPVKAAISDPACPGATVVTSMKFKPPGEDPIAVAPGKFTFAKARLAKAGKLQIYIATQDWPIAELGLPKSPIESADDAYLNLNIESADLAGGKEYVETGDLKSEISTTFFTNGLASGVFTAPPSKIKLLAYSADLVCGEFELQGMFDGEKTKMIGTFVAPISGK